MDESKVFMFPNGGTSGIDPGLLSLINNNGGFGGNSWIWIMFLWFIFGSNGWNNNGQLQNMINNNQGVDMLMQALNGRFDNLGTWAQMNNASVESVRSAVGLINTGIQQVASQVGMSGLQTINALQLGDANLSHQLCECCCDNRLAICNQTNQLSSQLAQSSADVRLQLAQNESADQLSVCQQTNTLGRQADANTNSILNAIAGQNTLITKEFCDLKERELQNKIDTQCDIITQLRGQISNDLQTQQFNQAFSILNNKITEIANKQPNTVPVTWPQLTAINTTPYIWNNGWGSNSFWN